MSQLPHQTIVIREEAGTSGLAIAGLIFSILGLFTCGLSCIPGAFLSFLALFSRGPKGTAIAGLIVGFPGTLLFALFGFTTIMGFLSLGPAVTAARDAAKKIEEEARSDVQQQIIDVPQTTEIETSDAEKEEVEQATQRSATATELPNIPVPEFDLEPLADAMRTWTATTGQTMEGKLVGFNSVGGKVRLQRPDGKKGTIDLKKFIEEDRQYVLDNKHFLESAEVLGTYYWNCPAWHQRDWWNTRTLIRWGDNYMQVIEVSVGHSTHPDFTTVYLVKRQFDEWKLREPGDISAFRVDEEYIVSESMTFARSQAEAKRMADAGS